MWRSVADLSVACLGVVSPANCKSGRRKGSIAPNIAICRILRRRQHPDKRNVRLRIAEFRLPIMAKKPPCRHNPQSAIRNSQLASKARFHPLDTLQHDEYHARAQALKSFAGNYLPHRGRAALVAEAGHPTRRDFDRPHARQPAKRAFVHVVSRGE